MKNSQKDRAENNHDIAIIGIAAKLPSANTIYEFWDNLVQGKDCICEIPEQRKEQITDLLQYLSPDIVMPEFIQAGYLDNIDEFDWEFFNISPKEASLMDPNQRKFLQVAWNAMEDAGYINNKIAGSNCGIYLGFNDEYTYKDVIRHVEPESLATALSGNLKPIIASRISYHLDLRGPTIMIDTSCSSSLVAVHMACQGLQSGDCDMAIAGSVKISLYPFLDNVDLGIMSRDGRTHAFDDSATGTGSGEGVIAIVLKKLELAIHDNDNIYAIIKGSAINQDGKSNGITSPNPDSQVKVLLKAWDNACIDPATINYIEAHGTGTKIGDPIEVNSLNRAFSQYTNDSEICAIGSVKSNIGHLDQAAGLAGLLKVVLALKYKKIPPTIHYNTPNKLINMVNSKVYINNILSDWNTKHEKRRAGVSSFGLSGTNCHVVLEEMTSQTRKENINHYEVFTLSAKNKDDLKRYIQEYIKYLGAGEFKLGDVCYSANTGRFHYKHRIAASVKSISELHEVLTLLGDSDFESEQEKWLYTEYIKNEKKYNSNKTIDTISNKEEAQDWCKEYINGTNYIYKKSMPGYQTCSVPGYPFSTKKCWLNIPHRELENPEVYYYKDWYENLLPTKSEESTKLTYSIIGCENSLMYELNQFIREKGYSATILETKLSEEQEVADNYLRSYVQDNVNNNIILFLPDEDINNYSLEQYVENFKSIKLLRRLLKILSEMTRTYSLIVVSKYGEKLSEELGEEPYINVSHSCAIAICKTAFYEIDNINCRCIDIDEYMEAEHLFNEIHCSNEFQTVYRKMTRFSGILKPLKLKTAINFNVIKNDGVYIIVGGFGSIGIEIVHNIKNSSNAKVIILARHIEEKRHLLQYNDIEIYEVDILNKEQVEKSISYILNKYNKIDGIYHCASLGVNQYINSIKAESDNDFYNIIAPKVAGTRNLAVAIKDIHLDFFCLFSSVSELVGGMGNGAYNTANAFNSSYSSHLRNAGIPAIVISWPLWQKTNPNYNQDTILKKHLFKPIKTEKALSLLNNILNYNYESVIIGEINKQSDVLIVLDRISLKISGIKQRTQKREEEIIDQCKIISDKHYSSSDIIIIQLIAYSLGLNEINTEDSFYDLGGDSIFAINLLNKINSKFGINEPISGLLENSVVDEFLKYMNNKYDNLLDSSKENISQSNSCKISEMNIIQRDIFIQCQDRQIGCTYNMPFAFTLKGSIDLDKMKIALSKFIERHEALRTSFYIKDKKFLKEIHEQGEVLLYTHDANDYKGQDIKDVLEFFIQPFDILLYPLFRVHIISNYNGNTIMFIDMHHLISDAASVNLLIRDIFCFYDGIDLLPIEKAKFNNTISAENKDEQENNQKYWNEQLSMPIPILQMELDYIRPTARSFAGKKISIDIDNIMLERMEKYARKNNITLYNLLLGAYYILLHKYTGQNDIIIGTPVSERNDNSLQDVIDAHIITLPIRMKLDAKMDINKLLQEVKKTLLSAYNHKNFDFLQMRDEIRKKQRMNDSLFYRTMLVMVHSDLKLTDLNISLQVVDNDFVIEHNTSLVDFHITAVHLFGKLQFDLTYDISLFSKDTMEQLLAHYCKIIELLLDHPDKTIAEINLVEYAIQEDKTNIILNF